MPSNQAVTYACASPGSTRRAGRSAGGAGRPSGLRSRIYERGQNPAGQTAGSSVSTVPGVNTMPGPSGARGGGRIPGRRRLAAVSVTPVGDFSQVGTASGAGGQLPARTKPQALPLPAAPRAVSPSSRVASPVILASSAPAAPSVGVPAKGKPPPPEGDAGDGDQHKVSHGLAPSWLCSGV